MRVRGATVMSPGLICNDRAGVIRSVMMAPNRNNSRILQNIDPIGGIHGEKKPVACGHRIEKLGAGVGSRRAGPTIPPWRDYEPEGGRPVS